SWGTQVVGVTYEDDEGAGFFPHLVDHRYLETMAIPLVSGRRFTADDHGDSSPVAIVNETAQRLHFPDGQAVGHFFTMWFGEVEVVGVVGDVKHRALDLGADPEFYFPLSQVPDFSALDLVVRTRLPAEAVAGPVGAAIRAADPEIPVEDFWTLDSVVEGSVSPRRFTLQVLSAFAVCALLLAALGIYGVLSYSVTERIPEIRIRMALGESAAGVRRGVVLRTVLLATCGVALGTVAALFGSRLVSSLLFGVEPTDAPTYAVIVVVLLVVATLSGLLPAIRASRTESAGALRSMS
ncbi:MAG: FtsX-like permease family protein, partial [Longimicrobiales bacterium]